MKTIQLTQDQVALVDDEDYERIIAFGKWYAIKDKRTNRYYARNSIRINIKECINTPMHRIIMNLKSKSEDPRVVDHEDDNGLNNQKYNLRIASVAENSRNRKKPNLETSSIYKGVVLDRNAKLKKWMAQIGYKSKTIKIGRYITQEEAALAYNKKAIELFGKFASLNIIPIDSEHSDITE